MKWKWIFLAPLALAGFLLFIALGGWVVQLLWNWLLPPIFGWPVISFWQAIALLALCRILFGGFGMHGSPGSRIRRRVSQRVSERMSERMAERWAAMSPEERERVRQRMRERCGRGPDEGAVPQG